MDTLSESQLIEAYRHGEANAFDALVKRHIGPIYRYLFRITQDQHSAEDLAQETFIKAWKNLSRFDIKRPFNVWLFTIARNTAFDYLKKKKALTFSDLEGQEGEDTFAESIKDERPLSLEVLENKERAADLDAALAQLPPNTRSVVLLHNTENMTFQEIAEAMNEPLNTVKSRYRRALESLRKLLSHQNKP